MTKLDVHDDDWANDLVAAGGVFTALTMSECPTLESVEVVTEDHGEVTNMIDVRFSFLSSAYRVTVERLPEEDA